MNKDLVTSATE